MTEGFLHYIWQFQYFDKFNLKTSEGEPLQIFKPGNLNSNAGPDFSNARMRIADLEWRGNVEVHIKASGWYEHHHDKDDTYENVILHVVWENDRTIYRKDGSVIPTLVLQNRLNENLWSRYRDLITSTNEIPCASQLSNVDDVVKLSMLDKALLERLESKAMDVLKLLKENKNDWDETCYQLLCRNFGFKVNNDAMNSLAKALPYKILLKHTDQLIQIEALLFGMAGFLEAVKRNTYTTKLKQEFTLLSYKYNLGSKSLRQFEWKFLRLRPANFPTLRLAQFAKLISTEKSIASRILSSNSFPELQKIFAIKQSEYWRAHYHFGKTVEKVPSFGTTSKENILINSVVPFLVAYGRFHDDQSYIDKAVDILQHVKPENNKITRQWSTYLKSKTAFDSQAILSLNNTYCLKHRCLDCSIGSSLIRPVQ